MLEHFVLLVHGLGSTFDHNWRRTGWVDILAAEGFTPLPCHLPGHGGTPADADPVEAVLGPVREVDGPVFAVGFSAGAAALIEAAAAAPGRFERLALLGIGDTLLDPPGTDTDELAAALRAAEEPEDIRARLFWRLTEQAGNDRQQVADYLGRLRRQFEPEILAQVAFPTLVVIGDRDEAGPADRLVAALPAARAVELRGVDHFGTPTDLRGIEAVVGFLTA